MKVVKDSYLRFIGLKFRDYKVFGGVNEFWFNRHQTIIVGKGGTGKTIISKALEHLGPPINTEGASTLNGRFISTVSVITEGNSELIERYRNFIFLDGEYIANFAKQSHYSELEAIVKNSARKAIASRMRSIFETILKDKPWKIDSHRDLNPGNMAAGERVCLGYAFVFAVREALKLDVPAVFDMPYARLDQGLRKGLCDFLKTQPCQQILLGHECEFSAEDSPKYILVYLDEYSQVMEF